MQPLAAHDPLAAEPPYLDTEAAARRLSCKARLLQSLRSTGSGPKYTRVGRQVRYRLDWLDAWAEANAVTSETEDVKRRPPSEATA